MPSPKLELPAKNVYRTGTITAIYFSPTRHPDKGYDDQIKVDGQWEKEGPGHFYTSVKDLMALTKAGLVAQLEGQTDSDGRPKFHVISARQRLAWIRAEEKADGGGKPRTITKIFAVDTAGNPLALQEQPYPSVLNRPTPAAVAASGPVSGPGPVGATAVPGAAPGAPGTAPAAAAPPAGSTSPAAAPTLTPEDRKKRAREGWTELRERYGCAVAISAMVQLKLAQVEDAAAMLGDLDAQVIQAGAATVFIESNRQMVPVTTGLAKALFEQLAHPESTNGTKPGTTRDARGVGVASVAVANSPLGPPTKPVAAAVGAGADEGMDDFPDDPEEPFDNGDDLPF